MGLSPPKPCRLHRYGRGSRHPAVRVALKPNKLMALRLLVTSGRILSGVRFCSSCLLESWCKRRFSLSIQRSRNTRCDPLIRHCSRLQRLNCRRLRLRCDALRRRVPRRRRLPRGQRVEHRLPTGAGIPLCDGRRRRNLKVGFEGFFMTGDSDSKMPLAMQRTTADQLKGATSF